MISNVAGLLLTRQVLLRRIGLPCVVNNSIGSIRFNETDRSTFAVSSLWGKFGGPYTCGATFPYTVPLPNIFVTHLFSKQTLERKDFQGIVRLTWAHRTRLQQLPFLLLTANVSNKSGNLLFAQSYPQWHENVGFLHSTCTAPAGYQFV